MKKAFLYIRVSTDEQADTGYSQRSQCEILTRYCEINNITIIDTFYEDHSAKNFNRPTFSKLLITLRKHKNIVDLVLFTKWDRFSRNAGDAYQMISTLNKLSVDPQAIEQPLNLEIPENKMMLAFYLAAPEVENDRRALNVFGGMRRAKKEGRYMGKAPIGYCNKISEDGKKYIAPNEEALIIEWVFEQLAKGTFTVESIWKHAQERGLKCGKNAFWNALRNPVYCGKIKLEAYKNEEGFLAEGKHQGIISEALFYDVQDILDGKKKKQRTKIAVDEKFPLRGHLICPKCKKLLTASASKGRKIYYQYYHCTSQCGTRFKAENTNDGFLKELFSWKPNPAVKELYKMILKDVYQQQTKERGNELNNIKKEMERLTQRKNKARELLLADAMESDDYRSIKTECERSMIQLEQKLSNQSTFLDVDPLIDKAVNFLDNIDTIYMNGDVMFKRDIIGSMFPGKLEFDGIHYRTTRVNEVVRVIYSMGEAFNKIKMVQTSNICDLYQEVIPIVQISNLFLMDLKKLAALAA